MPTPQPEEQGSSTPADVPDTDAPAEDGRSLRSAALVAVAATALALTAVASAAWSWPTAVTTAVAAVALATAATRMRPEHAGFSGVLAWCVVTGFAENAEAVLSVSATDLLRLALLVLVGVVASLLGARRPRATGPRGQAGHAVVGR